jgi:hypothetical protein
LQMENGVMLLLENLKKLRTVPESLVQLIGRVKEPTLAGPNNATFVADYITSSKVQSTDTKNIHPQIHLMFLISARYLNKIFKDT